MLSILTEGSFSLFLSLFSVEVMPRYRRAKESAGTRAVRLIFILTVGWAVFLGVPLAAAKGLPSPAPDENRQRAAQFTESWEKRGELTAAAKGIELLKARLAERPNAAADWVLLSYLSYWRGMLLLEQGGKNKEELLKTFEEGRNAALRAQALDPAEPGAYFWQAVNFARFQGVKGVSLESLKLFGTLKALLAQTAERDADYYYTGNDRFWGRVLCEIPAIVRLAAGYSLDEAVKLLENAFNRSPDFLENGVYLAEALLQRDKEGDKERAKKLLERMLAAPAEAAAESIPENVYFKRRARLLLRERF